MILFRSDSSFEIGIGHIARCLNLAEILRQEGFEVQFVCENRPGHINEKIRQAGFWVHTAEAGEDISLIHNLKPEWLILDHYEIDELWEKQFSSETRIFVIDDLVNRRHDCHVLLDQNYRKEIPDYKSLVPSSCRLLLGPHYTLLKPELQTKPVIQKIPSHPQVLVFFGGADENGDTARLAQALIGLHFNFKFVLVGLSSQKKIRDLKRMDLPSNIKLEIDPPHWIELLKQSHFYIGSAGSVTWERMFLGLPGAVLAMAPNQVGPTRDLGEMGYQFYWGLIQDFDFSELQARLENVFSDPEKLELMASKGQELVHKFDASLVHEIFSQV